MDRISQLQHILHQKRKEKAVILAEISEIESELIPLLNKEAAFNKLKRAGLTLDDLELLKDAKVNT